MYRGRGGTSRAYRESHVCSSFTSFSHKSSFDQITINLEVDHQSLTFLASLRNYWNLLKKAPLTTKMLHDHLDTTTENPSEQVLRLSYNCLDFKEAKPKSLAYFVIEEFGNWKAVKTQSGDDVSHLLLPQIKIAAFNVARQQRALDLVKLVVVIYEINGQCDVFFPHCIDRLIDEKRYKEACQLTPLLRLQDRYEIDEFLLPLVLQDKMSLVDDFLRESSRHRLLLVTALDTILGDEYGGLRNALESICLRLKIPHVQWHKIHGKTWRKLIARLVKLFHLPTDCTPNLSKKRNEGALQFLLHKRYVEKTFSYDSWAEMIKEAVKDDAHLQKLLVTQVALHGEPDEALKWARFYNVSRDDWPHTLFKLVDGSNNHDDLRQRDDEKVEEEEIWNIAQSSNMVQYHCLLLPMSSIKIVDDGAAFEFFINSILQGVNIVGIDCEWKPSFGTQRNELSLMQIATRSHVFILDIISLSLPIFAPLWQKLDEILFSNGDILKLGFNFAGDIAMMRKTLANLGSFRQISYLDLLSLWKHLNKSGRVKLPFSTDSTGAGLNTLVQLCLGKPLDKSDQFSNWENRPLRESQLVYAALDAYCLIEIHDALERCCNSQNFPFQETCHDLVTNSLQNKVGGRKSSGYQKSTIKSSSLPQPDSPHVHPVSAKDVRFVCDTMLQGLGGRLRRCGIDTVILANNDDHTRCVRLADDENRYILTRGGVFDQLRGYVAPGHCLKVIADNNEEQFAEVVCYYKIRITEEDIFTRCQMCNFGGFIKVGGHTLNALVNTTSDNNYAYGFDEATGFSSPEEEDDEEYYCEPPPPSQPSLHLNLLSKKCSSEKINMRLGVTALGAKIQIEAVPKGILKEKQVFYICEQCGKIYWDGSHYERVLSGSLKNILSN